MRIDLNPPALNNVASPQASKTENSGQPPALQGPGEDKATLSTDAASIAALTAKALSSAQIRQDMVDALRQSIRNGEYKVEPDQIAAAMIREAE
jgi:negative regulator of flagellin synthesis FlgM